MEPAFHHWFPQNGAWTALKTTPICPEKPARTCLSPLGFPKKEPGQPQNHPQPKKKKIRKKKKKNSQNNSAPFYNKYSCSFCGWFHNCVVPLSGKTCGRSFRTFGVHAQKGLGFFGAKLGSPRITLLHPFNRIRTYLAIWHWFDTICVLYIISTFSSACITTHIYI